MANTVMGLGGNMVIWQLLGIALIVAPNHNLGPLDIRFLDLLRKETLLSLKSIMNYFFNQSEQHFNVSSKS